MAGGLKALYTSFGGVMKRAWFKIPAALALCCAFALPASWCGEESGDCRSAAMEIISSAKANGVNKISVLGFTAKAGVDGNEADYISEKIASYLAGRKKPALIERALLEKVLNEARLSSDAGTNADNSKMLRDIFSIDAVVTGAVYASGDKLKVLTRLIDIKTGRVLLAARSVADREWPQFPAPADADFKWDSPAWTLPPLDFRDAVSDSAQDPCTARKQRLGKLNSDLVDEKALYWAAKIKEPGFSIRGLSKNPGTEITDPATKARFYKLLNAYYKSENALPPGPDKLPGLMDLMKEEKQVSDECGNH